MLRIEKIVKKVLREMKFDSLDDLETFGEYAKIFSKSDMKMLNKYLHLIRDLGVVNMFQAGDFLLMSPEYFKDFMKLKSYERDYDENILEEVEGMMPTIINIMISASIKIVESKGVEITPKNVERQMKILASTTLKYYMKGIFKN